MVNEATDSSVYHEFVLDDLPEVDTFLGVFDLKTGALMIAAICVLHPMVYGCTLFMPMSYLLVTIWLLLGLFFVASVLLFWALIENDTEIMNLWIWYTVLFVLSMVLLLLMLALLYASKKQWGRVAVILLGILWYFFTVYFIIVINSHRQAIIEAKVKTVKDPTDSDLTTIKSENPSDPDKGAETIAPPEPVPEDKKEEDLKILRSAFSLTSPDWFRRKERTESASAKPPEFDCSSLAPGSRYTRGKGLSPEVFRTFSVDETTTETYTDVVKL